MLMIAMQTMLLYITMTLTTNFEKARGGGDGGGGGDQKWFLELPRATPGS